MDHGAGAPQSGPLRQRSGRHLAQPHVLRHLPGTPLADRDYGARRNGTPFINAQPRFGIYRDWRAEAQTIYFDKIIFWNADPAGDPERSLSPPPR